MTSVNIAILPSTDGRITKMTNIYYSSYPIYILLKILGLFSLSYDGLPSKGILKVKPHDILLRTLSVITSILIIVIYMIRDSTEFDGSIVINGWNIVILFGLLSCAKINISQIWLQMKIVKMLNSLNKFDCKIILLGVQLDHSKHRNFLLFMTIPAFSVMTFVLIAPSISFWILDQDTSTIMSVCGAYLMLYMSSLSVCFIFACLAIKFRFQVLNETFKSFYFNEFHKHIQIVRPKQLNVKTFSRLFYNLCDAIDFLNDSLTYNLIPVMIYIVSTNVFVCYGSLRIYMHNEQYSSTILVINGIWGSFILFLKLTIAHVGSSTTRKAEEMFVLIGNLVNEIDWNFIELHNEMKTFLRQIRCRNLRIQNGIFVVNWNLITSVSVLLICQLTKINSNFFISFRSHQLLLHI